MSRDEVFKATGPTSGASMSVKIGVTKDGKITAAEGVFKFQAGAFPGSPVMNACLCSLRLRDRERAHGRLRRRVQPAEIGRLPGAGLADLSLRGRERPRHAGQEDRHGPAGTAPQKRRRGHRDLYGAEARPWRLCIETVEACLNHPDYKKPLGPNQGRGVASGYWFNGGGEFERHGAESMRTAP